MATYNNKHWLLSNIRNSFISTDDTGMCEALMLSDDLPSKYALLCKNQVEDCSMSGGSNSLADFYFYPGLEQSDDDDLDPIAQSYDIQMDQNIGFHRQRSNTAQKLEKMNLARKRASRIKIVKCDEIAPAISNDEKETLFIKKEMVTVNPAALISRLGQELQQCTVENRNKFFQFARFDGTAHLNSLTKKMKIFLGMLPPHQRNYPMDICVISTAKIQEFIGLICYKACIAMPELQLLSVENYGLYITEEDGEIDLEFPPLDLREAISKFCFSHLTLCERKQPDGRTDTNRTMSMTSEVESILHESGGSSFTKQTEDLAKMLGHTTMMEAPLYRSYRVRIITKGLFKTEIQLGISGEKLEIDPVQPQNSKFWSRQKAINHSMDSVAWCEIVGETSSYNLCIRIVYSVTNDTQKGNQSMHTSASFKHYDFVANAVTAREIVEKINNIIEVRSSATRREYLNKHYLSPGNRLGVTSSGSGSGSGSGRSSGGSTGIQTEKRKGLGKISPKKFSV